MPRATSDRDPELTIRFGYDEEAGKQMIVHATSFCAFWRDQFGTIHGTFSDEEWERFHWNADGTWYIEEPA